MARIEQEEAGKDTRWPWPVDQWLRAHSFAPAWLPPPLRQPLVGCAGGTLCAVGAVVPEYVLNAAFPEFEFPSAFSSVVIIGTALLWGLVAALCASLVSALAINYFVIAPHLAWNLGDATDLLGFLISLASFSTLSVIASLAEGRRRELIARQAHEVVQERERARAAEELARLRSDLVANVSHELRTPLTTMIGFAELLRDRGAQLGEAQRLEYLAHIAQAATRQQRLVEDLLLLSGLDGEALLLDRKAMALLPLMEQAAAEVRGIYADQAIACSGPGDLVVRADPDRVLQILVNLVDNAAKYSSAGSPVEVTCRIEEGHAVVRVRDHGPGIAERNRAVLFSRFGRIPGSRSRAGRVGTGLGLYLSRRLAEAMGGDLDLETSSQEGSTFRLRLPAMNDPAEV